MDLAAAFADIGLAFSQTLGGPFHAARVIDQVGAVYDDGGSIITPGGPVYRDCMCQIDGATQRMREAPGYVIKDMAFVVLADTLTGTLGTEARIEVLAGPHAGMWSVELIELDTMALGWVGRGRKIGVLAGDPELPIIRHLSGGITGSASLYAALSLGLPLSGDVIAYSSLSASLLVSRGLAGGIAGVGVLTGLVSTRANMAGSLAGTGALTGLVSTRAGMVGSIAGLGDLAGLISVRVSMSGAISGAGTVAGSVTNTPGQSYAPESQAYFAAMTVQPDATRKSIIDDLIKGLKTDGVWPLLGRMSLLASHDEQAALLDVKYPAKTMSKVNGPTFAANLGVTGDGATSYLSFGEEFGAPAEFLLDSSHVAAWCNQQGAGTGDRSHVARAVTTSPNTRLNAHSVTGTAETFVLNDGTSSTARNSTGSRTGYRVGNRPSASAKQSFYNGVLGANLSVAAVGLPTGNALTHRSANVYSPDRLAVVHTGGGLTEAHVASFNSRLNTYLTAIGAN